MWFAVVISFLTPISHSLSNICDSFLANKAFKSTGSIIFYCVQTKMLLLLPILYFLPMCEVPTHLWGYIIAVSALDLFYLFPYYIALKKLDTSIVAAFFSLAQITVPVMAFFLVNEVLGISQYIGFIIVIGFNFLLAFNPKAKIKINSGFWLMLLASFMCALTAVLYKKILEETDWITFAVWEVFVYFGFSLFFFIPKQSRQNIIKSFPSFVHNIKVFIPMEVFTLVGTTASIFAISRIPVSVNEAIGSTQPIFALLFGIALHYIFKYRFKENVSKKDIIKKMLCFAMITVGVVFVIP